MISIEPTLVCWAQASPWQAGCPKLSHLRLKLHLDLSERFSLQLGWDPYTAVKPTWNDSYGLPGQKLPPRPSWFDHYALRWQLANEWELSLEDWSATTLIPDASGLQFAQSLQDSGWKQSALRLTLIKPESMLSLVFGLGEGESFKERDAKPYLGIVGRSELLPSLHLQLAASLDTDSLPPDSQFWMERDDRELASRGFSAERQAFAFILDPRLPRARGLQLAIGAQRNIIKGPKESRWPRAAVPEEGPFDPTELLAESLGGHGPVERLTRSLSGSYFILAEYLLAFHWQELDIKLGPDAELVSCSSLDLNGACLDPVGSTHGLKSREHTFGFGKVDEQGWRLIFEFHSVRYDRLYELYHFASGYNHRQKSVNLVQTRLSWSW